MIIPLALYDFMNGLLNLESAAAAGDSYPRTPALTAHGMFTLIAAICGSCFPTTIYTGHPGWKAMETRHWLLPAEWVICCCALSNWGNFASCLLHFDQSRYGNFCCDRHCDCDPKLYHIPRTSCPGCGCWAIVDIVVSPDICRIQLPQRVGSTGPNAIEMNQFCNHACPARLMIGTETCTCIPVVVLMEEKMVTPVGVSLKFRLVAKHRSLSRSVTGKDFDQPLGEVDRHFSQSFSCPDPVGHSTLKSSPR